MSTTETASRLKRLNPWHAAFVAFALGLFLFLAVRGSDPDRWSDWGFGDAQTLLSLRQWNEGGWLENYLLFIPQGYAKVVKLFDQPALRQHAHGTCPGSSPRVGPRLWYTHYPAGYLVPYAALFGLGADTMPAARVLSSVLSVAAIVLLYYLLSWIVSPPVAFVSSVLYGLSPVFLGYADSLANQPIDDLLRFGFMVLVAYSTRASTQRGRNIAAAAAWAAEFCLSLSSFDSVFFVWVWLVGWDVLEGKGFRWLRYLAFGMAPVSAHGLQFLQNVWYLGWDEAVVDIKDTFLLKAGAAEQSRIQAFWVSVGIVLKNTFWRTDLLWAGLGLYAFRRLFLRIPGEARLPGVTLLVLLFLSGLAYVFVLPHGARMPYQGRQMLPFVAVGLAGLAVGTLESFRRLLHPPIQTSAPGCLVALLRPVWLVLGTVATGLVLVFFVFSNRAPVYAQVSRGPDVDLAKSLSTFQSAQEPVFFDLDGFSLFWDPNYVPGYPQIMPLLEYYAGSRPILCFRQESGVVNDLTFLLQRSPFRFSPVLVARDPDRLRTIVEQLRTGGVLTNTLPIFYQSAGRHVVDLTPALKVSNAANPNP